MKIEVSDLSFAYSPQIPVLQHISLSFKENELVAIVGSNGVGKTTFVKLLIGMERFTEGEITNNGESIKKKSIAELASKIGFVFQNPNTMIFTQKIQSELELSLQKFQLSVEEKKQRIQAMYDFFDLGKYQNTHPRLLSRGEKQKLSIATVLVQKPDAIILDEPFSGIDGNQKKQISDYLVKLKQQGKLVIIITHDLDFVAEFCDRVIAFHGRKIAFDGKVTNFFSDKKNLTTIGLTESPYLSMLYKLRNCGLPTDILKMEQLMHYLAK